MDKVSFATQVGRGASGVCISTVIANQWPLVGRKSRAAIARETRAQPSRGSADRLASPAAIPAELNCRQRAPQAAGCRIGSSPLAIYISGKAKRMGRMGSLWSAKGALIGPRRSVGLGETFSFCSRGKGRPNGGRLSGGQDGRRGLGGGSGGSMRSRGFCGSNRHIELAFRVA